MEQSGGNPKPVWHARLSRASLCSDAEIVNSVVPNSHSCESNPNKTGNKLQVDAISDHPESLWWSNAVKWSRLLLELPHCVELGQKFLDCSLFHMTVLWFQKPRMPKPLSSSEVRCPPLNACPARKKMLPPINGDSLLAFMLSYDIFPSLTTKTHIHTLSKSSWDPLVCPLALWCPDPPNWPP